MVGEKPSRGWRSRLEGSSPGSATASGSSPTWASVQPNPRGLFCAVNRLIDACEDLFDLAIELSLALLSMMTCLTREEPVPGHRAASGASVRCSSWRRLTAQGSGMLPPTVRWTPSNCPWLVGWNLTPFG